MFRIVTLTWAELRHVVDALRPWCCGALCQEVRSVKGHDHAWVLQLRRPGETRYLYLDAAPAMGRLHFVDEPPPQQKLLPSFAKLLRNELRGRVLDEITLSDGDRIVYLRFAPRSAEDGERAVELSLELLGRSTNLLLLDIDAGSGRRIVRASAEPVHERRGFRLGDEYTEPEGSAPDRGTRDGWPSDEDELHSWIADWFGRERATREIERARRELTSLVDRELDRLDRAAHAARGDAARAKQVETLRRRGELLQTAWGRVERGASSVRVVDYATPGQPQVDVPLDPKRDLAGNIDRLFRRARRLERGRKIAEQRIVELEQKAEQLRDTKRRIEDADNLGDLNALREALKAEHGVRRQQRGGGKGSVARERKPYRHFVSSRGDDILVGRGAKDNDELTFQHARGRDLWLHARDWAGAHVIVRMDGDDPPDPATLYEAAGLAALHSEGRRDTVVSVDYTRRKYVRKAKGAAPGAVYLSNTRSIDVDPRDEQIAALMKRGPEPDTASK